MSVKIRLKRVGKKKAPSYRVVVADSRSPRDGRIIENIGWYNPLVEPSAIKIDEERALRWLKVGAQPTESVTSLLKRTGVLERFEQMKSTPTVATEAE
jgi:small subunit ribosomal protein S16